MVGKENEIFKAIREHIIYTEGDLLKKVTFYDKDRREEFLNVAMKHKNLLFDSKSDLM